MNSLYVGKIIISRLRGLTLQKNKSISSRKNDYEASKLIFNAIVNGNKKQFEDLTFFVYKDEYWVTIDKNGKVEIGEGAA
jgi:hypothetical protein